MRDLLHDPGKRGVAKLTIKKKTSGGLGGKNKSFPSGIKGQSGAQLL